MQNQIEAGLKQFLLNQFEEEFGDQAQNEIESMIKSLNQSKDVIGRFTQLLKQIGKIGNQRKLIIKSFMSTQFYKSSSPVSPLLSQAGSPVRPFSQQQIKPTIQNYEIERLHLNDLYSDRQKMLESLSKSNNKLCLQYRLYEILMEALVDKNQILKDQFKKLMHKDIREDKEQYEAIKKVKQSIELQGRGNSKITNSFKNIENKVGCMFDHLMLIKKQLNPIDVIDLQRLIEKSKKSKQQVEKKSIILFIGDTGSGKTTTILSLLGYRMLKKIFKGMTWITTDQSLTDQKLKLLHSSPEMKSITRYALAILPKEKLDYQEQIWFVDTPGFGDSAGSEVDLANGIGTVQAIRACKYVRTVVVISSQSWGARGKGLRDLAKLLGQIFGNYSMVRKSVTYVFNRYTPEAVKEMNSALKSLVENPKPQDRSNQNLMSLYCDLIEKTMDFDDIINFNPLIAGQYKKVLKKIMASQKLKNPNEYFNFSFTQSTLQSIKQQCIIYDRIITNNFQNKYYRNSYFYLKIFKLFKDLFHNQFSNNNYQKCINYLNKQISHKYQKLINDFNDKVQSYRITCQNILGFKELYQELINCYKIFKQILTQLNNQKNFEQNLIHQSKNLVKIITEQLKIKNPLSVCKILEINFPNTNILKQIPEILAKRIQKFKMQYYNFIKQEKYQQSVQSFRHYDQFLRLKLEYKDTHFEAIHQELIVYVPQQINQIISQIKKQQINEENCNKWKTLEQKIKKMKSSHIFIHIHKQTGLEKKLQQFKLILLEKGDKQIAAIVESFQHLKQIKKNTIFNIEERFKKLNELKSIQCLQREIQYKMDICYQKIQNYLLHQETTLQNICTELSNHDKKSKLRSLLNNLESALLGIEKLANLGNESNKNNKQYLAKKVVELIDKFLEEIKDNLTDIKPNFLRVNQIKVFQNGLETIVKVSDQVLIFQKIKDRISKQSMQTIKNKIGQLLETILKQIIDQVNQLKKIKVQSQKNIKIKRNLTIINNICYFLNNTMEKIKFQYKKQQFQKASSDFKEQLKLFHEQIESEIRLNINQLKQINQNKEEENYQNIMKKIQLRLKQINQIESKYAQIKIIEFEEITQFKEQINQMFEQIYTQYQDSSKLKKLIQQNRFIIMSKMKQRCILFHNIYKFLNPNNNKVSFSDLSKKIYQGQITAYQKKERNFQNYLNNENFLLLQKQLEEIKNNKSQQGQRLYNQFKSLLHDKIYNLFQQIKKKQKIFEKQYNQYFQYIQRLNLIKKHLQSHFENDIVDLIKKTLLDLQNQIKFTADQIQDELKQLIEIQNFQQAIKKYKQLRELENRMASSDNNFDWQRDPEKFKSKNLYMSINQKIKNIRTQFIQGIQSKIQNGQFLKCYNRLFQRASVNSDQVLSKLKKQMEQTVIKYFNNCLIQYENQNLLYKQEKLYDEISHNLRNIPIILQNDFQKKIEHIKLKKKNKKNEQRLKIERILSNQDIPTLQEINDQIQNQNKEFIQNLKNTITKFFRNIFQKELQDNSEISIVTIMNIFKDKIYKLIQYLNNLKALKLNNEICEKIQGQIQKKMKKYDQNLKDLIFEKFNSNPPEQTNSQIISIIKNLIQARVCFEKNIDIFRSISKGFINLFNEIIKNLLKNYIDQIKKTEDFITKNHISKDDMELNFKIVDRLHNAYKYMLNKIQFDFMENLLNSTLKKEDNKTKYQTLKQKLKKSYESRFQYIENNDFYQLIKNKDSFLKKIRQNFKYIREYQDIYQKYNDNKRSIEVLQKIVQQKNRTLIQQFKRLISNFIENDNLENLQILEKCKNIFEFLIDYESKINLSIDSQYEQQLRKFFMKQIANKFQTQNIVSQLKQLLDKKTITKKLQDLSSKKVKQIEKVKINCSDIQKSIIYQYNQKISVIQSEEEKLNYQKQKQQKLTEIHKNKEEQIEQIDCSIIFEESQINHKVKSNIQLKEKQIAQILIKLKLFSMYIQNFSEQCKEFIKIILNKYKQEFGQKFMINLGEIIQSYKSQASDQLICQQQFFSNFQAWKYQIQLKILSIEEILNNFNINKIQKQKLTKKYSQYIQKYDITLKQFMQSQSPNSIIQNIIQNIHAYGIAVQKDIRQGNHHQGHQLIALIFALWSIINSDLDKEGNVNYRYSPNPAQIIAIFCMLGLTHEQKLGNRLTQIQIGQGKTIIIAGLAAYFASLGYEVDCLCYSKYLEQRDKKQFSKLFEILNIKSCIKYGTMDEICYYILNPKGFFFDQQILKTLKQSVIDKNKFKEICNELSNLKSYIGKQPKTKKILLVDEFETFFSEDFYTKQYIPYTSIQHQKIIELISLVWDHRQNPSISKIILESKQLKDCILIFPTLQKIIKEQIKGMINAVRDWEHKYIIQKDKIAYKQKNGISFKAKQGYKTIFAYFYEYENGKISIASRNNAAQINLMIGKFSNVEFLKYFKYMLGMTGNLTQEKWNVLKNYNINQKYSIPSPCHIKNLNDYGISICENEKYFDQIIKQTQKLIRQCRSVIIIFETYENALKLYQSQQFKEYAPRCNILYEGQEYGTIQSAIKKIMKPENIIIMTKSFGIGTDFRIFNLQLIEKGGIHIIQTFLSQEQSEEVFIKTCAIKQGNNGSYKLIIQKSQIQKIVPKPQQILEIEQDKLKQLIKENQKIFSNKKYNSMIKSNNLKQNHQKSIKMINHVLNYQNNKVYDFILNLNKYPQIKQLKIVKTILGIDGTASMSQILNKITQVIKVIFDRGNQIIKQSKKVVGLFEIQIAIYRNYNSPIQDMLKFTDFESKPDKLVQFLKKVIAGGGWGNQAIQLLYDHINQQKNVNQVIIIGDAAANKLNETINKRNDKSEQQWSKSQYKQPLDAENQLNKIIKRRIPINSFYILNEAQKNIKFTKEYFEKISKQTNGISKQFIPNIPKSKEDLISFILKNILHQFGDDELVRSYNKKYNSQ